MADVEVARLAAPTRRSCTRAPAPTRRSRLVVRSSIVGFTCFTKTMLRPAASTSARRTSFSALQLAFSMAARNAASIPAGVRDEGRLAQRARAIPAPRRRASRCPRPSSGTGRRRSQRLQLRGHVAGALALVLAVGQEDGLADGAGARAKTRAPRRGPWTSRCRLPAVCGLGPRARRPACSLRSPAPRPHDDLGRQSKPTTKNQVAPPATRWRAHGAPHRLDAIAGHRARLVDDEADDEVRLRPPGRRRPPSREDGVDPRLGRRQEPVLEGLDLKAMSAHLRQLGGSGVNGACARRPGP